MIVNDSELISRVLAYDDKYAFSQLVKKYQSPIRLFLLRLLQGDIETADELAQETFYIGLSKNKTLPRKISFLDMALCNCEESVFTALKKKEKTFDWETDTYEELPPTFSSEDRIDIEKAIQTLKPIERAVITLQYAKDLSHNDIANILEVPLGSVKTHVMRAKDKLRNFMNPNELDQLLSQQDHIEDNGFSFLLWKSFLKDQIKKKESRLYSLVRV